MSSAVLLDRPAEAQGDVEWVELHEPPTVYPSQEAMRSGPRAYSTDQFEFIDAAVCSRTTLPAPPLPID